MDLADMVAEPAIEWPAELPKIVNAAARSSASR